MGFEIIKAETRTARMIEWFSGICSAITDFLPGSKIRSKFETIAVEMEAQDFAFYQAIKKAIPISIYQAFNFTLLPAQKASGLVTFTSDGTTYETGMVLKTAAKVMATTEITVMTIATSPYRLISMPLVVDGVTLKTGDRVLINTGFMGGSHNGIWTVMNAGTGANGQWLRASDLDEWTEFLYAYCYVTNGTNYSGRAFKFVVADTGTINTTAITVQEITPTAKAINIPAGTMLGTANASDNKTYATTEDAVIPIGQATVQAPILCSSPGEYGNTPANTITRLLTTINGVSSVTNPAAITNGSDRETEESRRIRFNKYISTLTRGTKEAIEYGASTAAIYDAGGATIESVKYVNVVQPAEEIPGLPAGEIYCYIYNGSGATSDTIVAEAQKIIDGYVDASGGKVAGYKAAGVLCYVAKATEQQINVTCTVTRISAESDPDTIQSACVDAITQLIQGQSIGNDIIYSQIISKVMEVDGIYRVTVATPASDITIPNDTIPTVGTIAVTVV